MAYAILYSPEAVDHIAWLAKTEQVRVLDDVDSQLTHQPTLPTRKRKVLRANLIAPWQLRLDNLRVFYEVLEEPEQRVVIKAVGKKIHNELWIAGERIEI